MKNKIFIGIIKEEDIERRAIRCFDDTFVDVSSFCGYLSTLDLGKLVYRLESGDIYVEDNIKKNLRLKNKSFDPEIDFLHKTFFKKLR